MWQQATNSKEKSLRYVFLQVKIILLSHKKANGVYNTCPLEIAAK